MSNRQPLTEQYWTRPGWERTLGHLRLSTYVRVDAHKEHSFCMEWKGAHIFTARVEFPRLKGEHSELQSDGRARSRGVRLSVHRFPDNGHRVLKLFLPMGVTIDSRAGRYTATQWMQRSMAAGRHMGYFFCNVRIGTLGLHVGMTIRRQS
jgi:hypothetical protein